MTVFSYRAINDDNTEVRGQIDAQDLDGANRALEDLHLDVVEVYEATRMHGHTAEVSGPQPVLQTTFAFEGTDQAGITRRGTMQAETKYQAFERLKQDQKLLLTMLSPLGITPQYRDNDLENWQRKERAKAIGFTLPDAVGETVAPPLAVTTAVAPPPAPVSTPSPSYHPLLLTLRLYGGWLLAWYGLFVAIGYYATVRQMPLDIPFVQAFFVSPLIFSFIVAIFLFLMLGAVHRAIHGKIISGMMLSVVGIIGCVAVRWNL